MKKGPFKMKSSPAKLFGSKKRKEIVSPYGTRRDNRKLKKDLESEDPEKVARAKTFIAGPSHM